MSDRMAEDSGDVELWMISGAAVCLATYPIRLM